MISRTVREYWRRRASGNVSFGCRVLSSGASLEGRKRGAGQHGRRLVKWDFSCGGQDDAAEMRVLYDYNAWANHRSLDAASALSEEKFVRAMGSSFGSVRDNPGHLYGAEWIWLERFRGARLRRFQTRRIQEYG